ncbi:MAG TPA: c-type cytochrome [Thermoanaerobaculia bacterium]|nr:c-type cytochrome [Thermoanaerobaculia bacterium]
MKSFVPFVLFVVIIALSCQSHETKTAAKLSTGGDPAKGKVAIDKYGCNACHTIPGIEGPKGMVGPPLDHFASRAYIAGKFANNPETLIKWLQNPTAFDPNTTMPNMGVTEAESRDIAAYLYTLK